MYSFDEQALVGELAALHVSQQLAFAVAAATRQLDNYEWYARQFHPDGVSRPREITGQFWQALLADTIKPEDWSDALDEVMALLPEEGDDWDIPHSLAEDALSSLAYALRALMESAPQEAAWAARRAYEAADQAAIRLLSVQPGSAEAELAIKSHPVVQRELGRQRRDIEALTARPSFDSVSALRQFAQTEQLLGAEELALLA